jgi:hypothetical protein
LAVSACLLAISALGHRVQILRHRLDRASQLSQLLSDTGNVLFGRHVSPEHTGGGLRIGPTSLSVERRDEDVAVLFIVSGTIERGGLLRLSEPDCGLSTIADLPASLVRLRRNQLIEAERDGNAWKVGWGKTALEIARKAGVDVAPA